MKNMKFFILRLFYITLIIFLSIKLDQSKDRFDDIILLPVFMILLISSLLLISRMRTIFSRKEYLKVNDNSLYIESGTNVVAEYKWNMITDLLITYEGAKVFLRIKDGEKELEKVELCANWLYSEFFRSKKVAVKNYMDLMKFSTNKEFSARLDIEYKKSFIEEFMPSN